MIRHTPDAIRHVLVECIAAAREQGYEGTDREYEYTRQDMDWVVQRLGWTPTREQWEDAGLGYVGSAHVRDA